MRVARLRNPLSRLNRGRAAGPLPAGVADLTAGTPGALDAALAELAAAGVDLVVVDGGDGTVREVASRLPGAFGDRLPALGILANGNTNLVARHAGRIGGADGVARLAAGAPARERRLRPLSVDLGAGGPPVAGFILGWGAYEAATRAAGGETRRHGAAQVAGAVLSTLRGALAGGEAARLRAGVEGEVSADGRPRPGGRRFLGIATTLRGALLPGIEPFWNAGDGPLRWLDVLAPVRGLALAALPAAVGRPFGWMERAGWHSGTAGALTLRLSSGIVIDGEAFAAAGRTVRVTAGPELRFLSA